MRLLLCVAVIFTIQTLGLVLLTKLRKYRIDIDAEKSDFSGSSFLPIVNYLSPQNYSREGRGLLAGFWVVHIVTLIAMAIYLA
jgi:hypothetical protein